MIIFENVIISGEGITIGETEPTGTTFENTNQTSLIFPATVAISRFVTSSNVETSLSASIGIEPNPIDSIFGPNSLRSLSASIGIEPNPIDSIFGPNSLRSLNDSIIIEPNPIDSIFGPNSLRSLNDSIIISKN